jgi:ESS family glutamate:Na+ symporter
MATVGLLASTLVGGLVVVIARARGWLMPPPAATRGNTEPALAAEAAAAEPGERLSRWLINLALVGIAVAIGCILMALLQLLAARTGGGFATVIDALPVFPLALIGSLLVRLVLERLGAGELTCTKVQSRIGTVSADLLIVAATACLDLSLLAQDWLPLTVLALIGLAWNLAVVLLLARHSLPAPWFERGILEFGQATGVAASGLLLLNMADPDDQSDALTPFSIKQLLLQPLLAGGVITVVAPLAIAGWGLPVWTGVCLGLTVLWIVLALLLGRLGGQAAP